MAWYLQFSFYVLKMFVWEYLLCMVDPFSIQSGTFGKDVKNINTMMLNSPYSLNKYKINIYWIFTKSTLRFLQTMFKH